MRYTARMNLQNRVLPTGEITAQPWRGTLMGNRGILHDDDQQLGRRRWQHPHWVTCRLSHKGWHHPVMTPRNYTELFFLDEATALAAGHRPCALCRREDFNRFRHAWAQAHGRASLRDDDRVLHAARVTRQRRQRRHQAAIAALPDGCFILFETRPHLLWRGQLLECEGGLYTRRITAPRAAHVTALTPAPTIKVLARGYRPELHSSARHLLGDPEDQG